MLLLMCLKELMLTKPVVHSSVIICHYCYFLGVNFGFQPKRCDGCHDLMQKAMSFNDAAIVSIKGSDYRIYLYLI